MPMENNNVHEFIQNLIQDDSFIRWVNSEFEEDNDRWSSYIDENIDQIDQINEAIHFVQKLKFADDESVNTQQLWTKIESSIGANTKDADNKVKSLFNYKWIMSIAAAACFVAVIFYRSGVNTELIQYATSTAEERVVFLPDSSSVRMNAQTSITFNSNNWKNDREVKMEGIAFYEVKKGSKFTVVTSKGNVQVLGTSFSVNTRHEEFEVICKTGKVSVTSVGAQEGIMLTPGDKSILNEGRLTLKSSETSGVNQIPWLDGVYTFDNATMGAVIEEFERQYDVKINISDQDKSILYNGFFKRGHLHDALYAITWPLSLKYRLEGKNVFITKESE